MTAPLDLDFRLRPHGSMLDAVFQNKRVSVYMGGYTAVFIHGDQVSLRFDSGSIFEQPADVAKLSEDVIIEKAYAMACCRIRPNHICDILKAIANARDLGFCEGRSSMASAFRALLNEAEVK